MQNNEGNTMNNTMTSSVPDLVTVAPATQNDYAGWLPHWLAYQEFYKVSFPEEVTLTSWSRFFDEKEPMFCAVARMNGKVIGFVHYLYHRSTWAEKEFCYLEDLYVDPSVRGQHIGKQLIEFVQQQALARPCGRLYWHTHKDNTRGQRLYDWVANKSGAIEYIMPLK
ncbi:TPA: GNAT family N-acetyltransferase [Morganella morganii]|nr:GNAT family N-acetyltransferase [Morganella morganii]ATF55696.1 N-acetyltransferase [Morganella morganii]AUR32821.1 N-acetyltransferase [Morganella morganii]EKV4234965.1 GNAT family N-acetyltransferase [Morganella morganii]ELA8729893.1 GNAT family N-acetyltransferase [Morganella morganii]ELB1851155.1 GNAT family N-acetyltransferase [Morganella morganii]